MIRCILSVVSLQSGYFSIQLSFSLRSYRENRPAAGKTGGQLATLRQRCAPVSQFATLMLVSTGIFFRLVRQHYRLVSRGGR